MRHEATVDRVNEPAGGEPSLAAGQTPLRYRSGAASVTAGGCPPSP